MYMLFGSVALVLGTAARFRWPQHVALAGIVYNLTIAVGCAVVYHMHGRWGARLCCAVVCCAREARACAVVRLPCCGMFRWAALPAR